jgi:hypothetical protein
VLADERLWVELERRAVEVKSAVRRSTSSGTARIRRAAAFAEAPPGELKITPSATRSSTDSISSS